MKGIDPNTNSLRVERMENGWIVLGGSEYQRSSTIAIGGHVARTPKELADLFMVWAQAQDDLPNSHPPRNP